MEKGRTKGLFKKGLSKVNEKFVKDGYIYLLRGQQRDGSEGIKSYYYEKENMTVDECYCSLEKMAFQHTINGKTPLISTTTDYMVAASWTEKKRIYIVKIPLEDIYVYEDDFSEIYGEEEYFVPDIIYKEEILKSFRYNKLKEVYEYLTKEIGLDILPEDLGIINNDKLNFDYNLFNILHKYNFAGENSFEDNFLDVKTRSVIMPFGKLNNSNIENTEKKKKIKTIHKK